jgi:hypothetical protein
VYDGEGVVDGTSGGFIHVLVEQAVRKSAQAECKEIRVEGSGKSQAARMMSAEPPVEKQQGAPAYEIEGADKIAWPCATILSLDV